MHEVNASVVDAGHFEHTAQTRSFQHLRPDALLPVKSGLVPVRFRFPDGSSDLPLDDKQEVRTEEESDDDSQTSSRQDDQSVTERMAKLELDRGRQTPLIGRNMRAAPRSRAASVNSLTSQNERQCFTAPKNHRSHARSSVSSDTEWIKRQLMQQLFCERQSQQANVHRHHQHGGNDRHSNIEDGKYQKPDGGKYRSRVDHGRASESEYCDCRECGRRWSGGCEKYGNQPYGRAIHRKYDSRQHSVDNIDLRPPRSGRLHQRKK